jgi:F420-non-reducing hydrogenase large subunit
MSSETTGRDERRITIDPITRLEGHGKIEILLDEHGGVDRAWLQVPELRGFEQFAVGRPAEDMPQITSRICGVCPMAHHMASTKALDALYHVEPPPAARKLRELLYSAFMVEDHALHIFFLGGPDLIVGPRAPAAERNVLGVIGRVGEDTGRTVIAMRRKLRDLVARVCGKAVHPAFGLPGGVSRPLSHQDRQDFIAVAIEAVEFARFTLSFLRTLITSNPEYLDLVRSEAYTHRTNYMGMVDGRNRLNFYDGVTRVVGPDGDERARFGAAHYLDYVAEHVEPWSYVKFSYFRPAGWQGFTEGEASGVFCVAPLARLNVADGLATPHAQEAFEDYLSVLGGRIVHHTLANHWARGIELLYAAERMRELAEDPEVASPNVRALPTSTPTEGVGIVEAPRGTLIHHYQTDERGVIRKANLIVATQNNSARMSMGIEKAAKHLIKDGQVPEQLLNMVEMAFRAYDPCHGCATHSLPGSMPLLVRVRDADGQVVGLLRRDGNGRVCRE